MILIQIKKLSDQLQHCLRSFWRVRFFHSQQFSSIQVIQEIILSVVI